MVNNVDRFNHLLDVISHDNFLNMQGIGNEVPFFICPFNPKEGLEMESKHQGLDNFRKYLEEAHEVRDYLFNKFKKALQIK